MIRKHYEKWADELDKDMHGMIIPSLNNFAKIIKNDHHLQGIFYNDAKQSIDIQGDVPWNKFMKGWGTSDYANLTLYMEKEYGIYAPQKCREAMMAILCSERNKNPVQEYLLGLKWDGISRVERLLVDYLGAEDTEYVRCVTKKTLLAAVARVFEPGVKFDNVLVICGPQGIGKSSLFAKLGREWYSDSLNVNDMKDKTAAEKLRGIWIMEIGELAGIRKVDVEIVKSFVSRADDMYRNTYGQCVESHPRRGIIVGSTNRMDGFLRDITGNRRFWPVQVTGNTLCKVWDMERSDIDQIWAEAFELYQGGEKLYLEGKVKIDATRQQENAMEMDPRQGMVEEYLEMRLPITWKTMSLDYRRQYLAQHEDSGQKDIERTKRNRVCILEIWCECMNRERQDIRKADAYEIEAILQKIGGWKIYNANNSGKTRIPGYGVQKTYVREENNR